jgi:competence protein ComEC
VPAIGGLAGALLGAALPVEVLPGLAIGLVAVWILTLAAYERASARGVAIGAAVGFSLAAATGAADSQRRALTPPLRHVLLAAPDLLAGRRPVWLEGRLREDAAQTDAGVVLVVDVTRVGIEGRVVAAAGGVRLVVGGSVDDAPRAWRAGRTVALWALVREPSAYRNPGGAGADEALRLARRGLVFVGSVKSGRLVEVTARGNLWAEAASAARSAVREAVARHVGRHDARTAGIVTAILIGDRAGLDPEVERRLQEAGTYHVIAISGGNIAILAGLVLGALHLLRAPPRVASGLAMLGLTAYAALVGPEPSVVRATLVADLYLAARLLDHRAPPLNSLPAAAALIAFVSPLAVFDAGFALSFGATTAILIGVPRLLGAFAAAWPHARSRWAEGPLGLLAATICAELAVAPLGAWWFSRVTFAGVLLNFAAVPLMTVVQVAGLATVGLAAVAAPAADLAGSAAHLAARGLVESARAVELAPWLVRRVPPPPMGVMAP